RQARWAASGLRHCAAVASPAGPDDTRGESVPPDGALVSSYPPRLRTRSASFSYRRRSTMTSRIRPLPPSSQWAGPAPDQELFQRYSNQEDAARTNIHYEQPREFFYAITGGEWNVYSCNLWTDATTDTESQEAKLDLLARLMELKPGQRILD